MRWFVSLYPHTIDSLRKLIQDRCPDIEAEFIPLDSINLRMALRDYCVFKHDENTNFYKMCQYLLWMIDGVEKMEESAKAGRWMGWILAYMEMLGFMTNEQSREMVRVDKETGNE